MDVDVEKSEPEDVEPRTVDLAWRPKNKRMHLGVQAGNQLLMQ